MDALATKSFKLTLQVHELSQVGRGQGKLLGGETAQDGTERKVGISHAEGMRGHSRHREQ